MAMPGGLFVWGRHYLTGIDKVDSQHEEIAFLLNELYDAARLSRTRKRQLELLDELICATAAHFKMEEAMMRDLAFEGLDLHKQEHDSLAREAAALRAGFKAGRVASLEPGLESIKDWLRNHLITSDRRMGRLLTGEK